MPALEPRPAACGPLLGTSYVDRADADVTGTREPAPVVLLAHHLGLV